MKNLFTKLVLATIVQIWSLLTGMQWIYKHSAIACANMLHMCEKKRKRESGTLSCTYVKYGLLCVCVENEYKCVWK